MLKITFEISDCKSNVSLVIKNNAFNKVIYKFFNYLCAMKDNTSYDKLREQLNAEAGWPKIYMFKFIIPSVNKTIALVESKFSDEAVITQKESTNGKYMSITIKEVMLDADSIINKYKEMDGIEGLMSF